NQLRSCLLMRWPFNRNRNVDGVPAEIQEYYQTERRERTGVAWLLALGTLIITVGLAGLLFFGGRWIYRTVANNNDDSTETTSQTEQSESTRDNESEENSANDSDRTNTSSTST